MEIKRGTPVSPGVAIGSAFVMESEGARIARKFVMANEIEYELERFKNALERSCAEIDDLAQSLKSKIDDFDSATDIFQIHLHILKDPELEKQITRLVRNKLFTPEYAVSQVLRRYVKRLEATGDAYLIQRVRDFDDIEQRLIRNLLGERREDLAHLQEPVLVIARDLTPSQTVSFDPKHVLAMATDAGGRTSHTAIIARAMQIPAVVGVTDLSASVSGGDTVIIDGGRGVVIVDPDDATIKRYQLRSRSLEVIEEKIAAEVCNLPAITRDGRRVSLEANIEFPQEIHHIARQGAEGVGLYRTEFLYHAMDNPPSEEDHFQAYLEALRLLGDRPMTIRVLDLGADKFSMGLEERNPFLGCRSMRLMRKHPQMFRDQIRAILRISALGKVRFMFPMIASLSELREAKQLVADVATELDHTNINYNKNVQIGIMIEIPSAALTAERLAGEVDFFSIGTNDLIQYTLAVDRNNEHVAHLYSPVNPAVLRLIKGTLDAGEKAGIEVAMCGEMAGDILYSTLLVGLGFQRFSMSPATIADVKKFICSITYKDARQLAERVLAMNTTLEIEELLRSEARKTVPELFEKEDPV